MYTEMTLTLWGFFILPVREELEAPQRVTNQLKRNSDKQTISACMVQTIGYVLCNVAFDVGRCGARTSLKFGQSAQPPRPQSRGEKGSRTQDCKIAREQSNACTCFYISDGLDGLPTHIPDHRTYLSASNGKEKAAQKQHARTDGQA
jgi:hypothetical protein